MTAVANQQPMTEELQRAALAVAEVERFIVDTRRVSVGHVIRRVLGGQFAAMVDHLIVLPVLRAGTPEEMHAALDGRVRRVGQASPAIAIAVRALRLARGRLPTETAGGWERVLEIVVERSDRGDLDPEGVARLRLALAGHAIAFRELRAVVDGRARVLDPEGLERASQMMIDATLPMFVLLAWSLGAGPAKPEIVKALGERVVCETDAFSVAFARAVELEPSVVESEG